MKAMTLIPLLFAMRIVPLQAQPTAEDDNAGLRVSHDLAAKEVRVDWFAEDGKYFFLQETTDLASDPWAYFPYAVLGTDAVEGIAATANPDKMFFRLWIAEEGASILALDFDKDGVNNGDELRRSLNVYDDSDLDSDSIPDDWEIFYGAFSASADNDGDGFTNGEENASGDDPNAINSEIAPPTLEIFGNYTRRQGVYEITDQGELSICVRTTARDAKTYYFVTAPHLEPYLRFDGSSTRAKKVTSSSEPEEIDPEAKEAPILTVNNGVYTIFAKSYLEHNGQMVESDCAEWEVKVRPYRTSGSQPSGVAYESVVAYYDAETGLYSNFSFNVPQIRRRLTIRRMAYR